MCPIIESEVWSRQGKDTSRTICPIIESKEQTRIDDTSRTMCPVIESKVWSRQG